MAQEGSGSQASENPISKTVVVRNRITFRGTDIQARFALGAGRASFFALRDQQTWIPILLELNGISALDFANGIDAEKRPLLGGDDLSDNQRSALLREWRLNVRVPGIHLRGVDRAPEQVFITALVQEVFFFQFLEDNQRLQEVVSRVVLGKPVDRAPLQNSLFTLHSRDDSLEPMILESPDLSNNQPSRNTVIVGIIDDGIAFAHERFRDGDLSTRVHYVWLQDREFDNANPPPGIIQGKELTKTNIDDALRDSRHAGLVDDDEVYRRLEVVDYSNIAARSHRSMTQRVAHGTHVMDVAAGYNHAGMLNQDLPAGVDVLIIAVQLPTDVTADTSGGRLEPNVSNAIAYIQHRADLIAAERSSGPIPLVINFSYGHHAGPHDGSQVLKEAIDQTIRERRTATGVPFNVVLPSGNGHLSRTHAQFSFMAIDETVSLPWRVLPDDKSPSTVEIWLPTGSPAGRIEVQVEAPNGEISTALGEVSNTPRTLPVGVVVDEATCLIDYAHEPAPASNRGRFLISLQPTELSDEIEKPLAPLAIPGLWTIHLTNRGFAPDKMIDAWIGRDDTPFGFPTFGRQSYFDHPDYEIYDDNGRPIEEDEPQDCPIKRAGTMNALATGEETIVIGSFCRTKIYRSEDDKETHRLAEYSAGGPTNVVPDPNDPAAVDRDGPDAVAVSEDSRVHRGILAAGTRSGSTVALNGTSVAAPQVTRKISLEMAAGTDVVRATVAGWTDLAEPPPPADRPDERWGHGRIEVPPPPPPLRYVRRLEP